MLHGGGAELGLPLQGLRQAVDRLVVVDNNAEPLAWPADPGVILLRNANRGGLAGAYNLAVQTLQAQPEGLPAAVVFVDQDSDPAVLLRFLADAQVQSLLGRADVAAVSPAYCDRATGLRGRYIELGRWRLRHLPRRFAGLRPVAFVINSMSVWRGAALQRIGPFNEVLAVDHVDTEYCLRARALGLSVWVHGDHEFAHSIGERRRYRLLGRELQAGGHGPQRRRLIGRNTMWLARGWAWREPAFAALCLLRLAYEAVGITIAEDRKASKLAALLRGIGQGLAMPVRVAVRR
ncbi:MAG: hypothetical protein LCI02_16410 [Proteobacteria bacterium]|nr:hypothetical protein [Pseudomonadota bacterium]